MDINKTCYILVGENGKVFARDSQHRKDPAELVPRDLKAFSYEFEVIAETAREWLAEDGIGAEIVPVEVSFSI
jgi:hypothetical protein